MKIMRTKILVTILALGVLAGCSKDKYNSKPTLIYKNVNTNVLNRNQSLTFTLQVTDKEGDIQDTIWVQEVVKNCSLSGGTSFYVMPDFPATKNLKGDIQICYSYGINLDCPAIREPQCRNRNDSAVYKFWLKDKEKNISDTVTSPQIVILQ
jgi:hypothetical protein